MDIAKCFDNIQHSSILEFYPLAEKYQYLLKAWLRNEIVGKKIWTDVKTTKWRLNVGVPQGSIIGPSIANVVLDTLEGIIKNGLPSKYPRSTGELEIISKYTGKTAEELRKTDVRRTPTIVHFMRFADDILIFGKASDEHFANIYQKLNLFLNERGLKTKEIENPVFEFRPGASFEYLGFKFTYVNPKHSRMLKGRFTRVDYHNPINHLKEKLSLKDRRGLLLTINQKSINKIRNKLKGTLNKSNITLSVNEIVKRYNRTLQGIINYFGVTLITRAQIRSIVGQIVFHKFRRILLQKFSSKPGVYGYVSRNYYTPEWLVQDLYTKGEKQLKPDEIQPYGNTPLNNLRPNKKILESNVYLNPEIWDKYEFKLAKHSTQQTLFAKREMSLKDIRIALHASQSGICSFCGESIKALRLNENNYVEHDHFPRIHYLKLMA